MNKLLTKILGLDRKEKKKPVEQTSRTQPPSTDPPAPPRDGLNLQNAAVRIPSPGGEGQGEGGFSAPAPDFRKPPSVKSGPSSDPLIFPSSHLGNIDFRNPATNREPRGKVAHLPPAVRHQVCEWISEGLILEEI